MNLIDRLIPVLIFAAAMLPTVVVVLAAAVLGLAHADPSLVLPPPVEQAVACEPCGVQAPDQ